MSRQPRAMALAAACALAAVLTPCTAAGAGPLEPKDTTWALLAPKEERVVFRGVVSFDAAGSAGSGMLYPAPNLGGFLAAVITHGVLVESTKKGQKDKLQQEADKVLSPYQGVLDAFTMHELMRDAVAKTTFGRGLPDASSDSTGRWIVEIKPVFALTQDHSAIVLDNELAVHAPGDASAPAAYTNVVRVVSQPQAASDLSAWWTANDGKALKEESARLLAESLDIALGQATGTSAAAVETFKTFRYAEGGTEKMERGQFVNQRCDRVVLKTLRGWLMSVPARRVQAPTDADSSCRETTARAAPTES